MASFSDLKSAAGLKELNTYLASRSYIVGFAPTTADQQVLAALGAIPDAKSYPHANRWFHHIAAFGARRVLPAGKVTIKGGSGGAAPAAAAADDGDDDDIDFFAEDDDADTEAKLAAMEERAQAALAAQAAKGKPKPIPKTSILLDVKPWDDTTDMKELEKGVREIEMDGLLWGQSKLVAVGYGIKKMQIMCVVEDDKVCVDDLDERICALEDYVQSIDVAAMNKI